MLKISRKKPQAVAIKQRGNIRGVIDGTADTQSLFGQGRDNPDWPLKLPIQDGSATPRGLFTPGLVRAYIWHLYVTVLDEYAT